MKPAVGQVKWLVAALAIRRSHCQRYARPLHPTTQTWSDRELRPHQAKLVNSRSPEALISHDSAPVQSTSVAAQFLTIQAFSRKCPIGHALDISFENWTSSLRIYTLHVGSQFPCHPATLWPAAIQGVSRHVIERLSQTRVIFLSGTDVLLEFRIVAGRLLGLPHEGRVTVPSLCGCASRPTSLIPPSLLRADAASLKETDR